MPATKKLIVALSVLSFGLTTSACVTDPETGEKKLSKAAIGAGAGAAGGALLGALVGGKKKRTEVIVGAGIGAIAGGAIGVYMDNQEKKLREQTAGTGIEVTRVGDELKLNLPDGVTFDVDSAIVKSNFHPTLDKVANVLAEYNQTYIDVLGHTDATGSDTYNMTLSQRRADSVANYLAGRGVQRARMGTQGMGESQPIATNDTAAGRALNRRVEIRVTPVTEQDVADVKK